MPMTNRLLIPIRFLLAPILMMLFSSCESTPAEKLIDEFIKEVNTGTHGSDVRASVEDNSIVLTYKLKKTPENTARLIILSSDEAAQQQFAETASKALTEGHLLARIVKEKRNLVYRVTDGEYTFNYTITPQYIRSTAFPKQ